MTNNGNVSTTLNCGSSYTIAAGYHGDGGTVTANSLSSQTEGNITAARVLNGYVGWSNGIQYTGTMNNWGAYGITISENNYATLKDGYYSTVVINAVPRYNAGYNDGYNSASVYHYDNFVAKGFSANSTEYVTSNSSSHIMSADGIVYYGMFSCGYDDPDMTNVIYLDDDVQVSRNIDSSYAWRRASGSFSANSGSVITLYATINSGTHVAGYSSIEIKY